MLAGTAAAAYPLYLLYIGIPIVYDIPKERGFMFASATVAVSCCSLKPEGALRCAAAQLPRTSNFTPHAASLSGRSFQSMKPRPGSGRDSVGYNFKLN